MEENVGNTTIITHSRDISKCFSYSDFDNLYLCDYV
jgi:hypothetical protein